MPLMPKPLLLRHDDDYQQFTILNIFTFDLLIDSCRRCREENHIKMMPPLAAASIFFVAADAVCLCRALLTLLCHCCHATIDNS